jgi:hypothetical protein
MVISNGWGSVTIGRITLRETFTVAEDDTREMTITGETSVSGLSADQVERIYEDLLGMMDQFVPIVWSDKAFLSGYYTVTKVQNNYSSYTPTRVASQYRRAVVLGWSVNVMRVGPNNVIDIESRLSGPRTRANDFGLIGEITHAPPVGHYGYTTDGTVPSSVTRASQDGPVTVYRQIPANTHPRYGCDPALFGGGRVRFIDAYGEERSGIERQTPPIGWALSNGIVSISAVSPGPGLFAVASWTTAGWVTRTWDVLRNGVSIGPLTDVDVLHNTYDTVILRITKALAPGRMVVDVTLRRGQRMADIYVQSDSAATLAVRLLTGEPGVSGVGTVSSVGEDIDGGRYVIASPKTTTQDLVNGGLSVTSAAKLGVILGAVPAAPPINPNYDMESGVTGWTAIGGTLSSSTDVARWGTKSAKLVTNGTPSTASIRSVNIPVNPATSYTVALWLYCPHGRAAVVTVDWLTAGGAVISTVTITPVVLIPNTWIPVLRDTTSPVTATQVRLTATIQQTIPWSALAGLAWNSLATWQQPIVFSEVMYMDQAVVRPALGGDTVADQLGQSIGQVAELVTGVRR